jgi:signal peptidase II
MPDSASSAKKKKRRPKLAVEYKRQLAPSIIILALIVLADQVSKILAENYLQPGQAVRVIGNFLRFQLTFNTGGALGTNLGDGPFYLIASLLVLGALVFLAYVNRRQRKVFMSLAIVAGGAIGNIIDRIRVGRITDFIDVDIPNINIFGMKLERWWTFNVADAAITVGVIVLLIKLIFSQNPDRKAAADQRVGQSE